MYSKAKIFNLALGVLLLQRQIVNPDTDQSNEAKVLLSHWDTALWSALEDMDLDSTSTQVDLSLVATDPNGLWVYAYKYPNNCAFFRRLQSSIETDNRSTHIPKRTGIYEGQKVIFTNQENAIAEYIPKDLPLNSLSPNAAMTIAAKLAELSSSLVTGKGARELRKDILDKYVLYKARAQAHDQRENFVYGDPVVESEFVEARTE